MTFALAGIVYACSPRSHATEVGALPSATVQIDERDADMRGELHVSGTSSKRLVLRVTNTGRKLAELRFRDGQTHDFIVRDASDRVVWRWSADRLFTQAIRTQPIERGESVQFAESWTPKVAAGTYTLVAELRAENHPIEVRQIITVP